MSDRLRRIIRAELASAGVTNEARRPMELLVETYLRPARNDAVAQGPSQLRNAVNDIIVELREKHPTLFNLPGPEVAGIAAANLAGASPHGAPSEVGAPVNRNWLDVASTPSLRPDAGAHEPGAGGVSDGITGQRKAPIDDPTVGQETGVPHFSGDVQLRHDPTAGYLEDTQPEIHSKRSSRIGKSLAVGAVVGGVALAIVGYYSLANVGRNTGHADGIQAPRVAILEQPGPAASTTGSLALPTQKPTDVLRGIPDVLDTATLWLEGKIVRLYGVEWAPGGGGNPDDFTRYVRGREAVCAPIPSDNAYRCSVEGKDLSEVVLFNGGGRAM
ncbi:MAG: hypothetical protein ABW003_05840, partial [Microvirga sp.]